MVMRFQDGVLKILQFNGGNCEGRVRLDRGKRGNSDCAKEVPVRKSGSRTLKELAKPLILMIRNHINRLLRTSVSNSGCCLAWLVWPKPGTVGMIDGSMPCLTNKHVFSFKDHSAASISKIKIEKKKNLRIQIGSLLH